MDYFEELEKLLNRSEELYQEEIDLLDEKEKEIKKVEENFSQRNKENIRDILVKKREIRKSLFNASLFKVNVFGPAFARVISQYEGEEYEFCYRQIDMDLFLFYELYFIAPITLDKTVSDEKDLRSNPDVLMFPTVNGPISLFDYNNNGMLVDKDYGKFNYLNDFAKYIINYRMNNIYCDSDLDMLASEFLKLKANEINTRRKLILK